MEVEALLASVSPSRERPVVFLTGAGFSAASGIPTFRGPEGYWTVGATEYRPEELATMAAFSRMPREVWRWYLYRKGVCDRAAPNAAHEALVRLEERLGDAFGLITQNVDGLHRRAGSRRLIEVHGNLRFMRDLVTDERVPIPDGCRVQARDAVLEDGCWERLRNPATGHRCRPHVLWFDESYDEENYGADSALRLASSASVLVIVGTSGAAAIPWHAAHAALARGAVVIDVNPEDNPFRALLRDRERGGWLAEDAVTGTTKVAGAWG